MRYPQMLLYFFCMALSSLHAQEKVELFNSLEQIAPLKTLDKTFDLKKGEDLIVTVTPMRGKLGKLIIDVPGSEFQLLHKKIEKLDREVIKVTQSGTYAFHFINLDVVGKRELDIKIYKQRTTIDKDTVILDDVIFSSFRDTIRTYKDDTIPIPDISEYSFVLSPSMNYGAISDSTIWEKLLTEEEAEYQYAAYWVGIGAESIKDYEKLKNNPPPTWALKGINDPLMAYGLGKTELLPISTSSLARDVMFKFVEPEEYKKSSEKRRLSKRDLRSDFYGRIPISSASKYRELFLSLRNFNTTTSVPVYIKIVKFKLTRNYYNQYIIRERVQEIFREKKMQVLAPEEG